MKVREKLTLALAALVTAAWMLPAVAQSQDNDELTEADDAIEVDSPATQSRPWPHQFTQSDQSFTVYPPQLDRWQGERIEARAAVAVQPPGESKPVYGTVWLSARTQTDAAGLVTIREISVSRASFPTATARANDYLAAVRQQLAAMTWQVPAERLRADLAIDQAVQQARSQPLRNDPPRIIYRQSPTILVPVDGQPVLREVPGLDLLRVVNTRALILSDKTTGRYFLFVADRWLDAPALEGPWTDAQVRPAALDEAKQQAVQSEQVDLLEGSESTPDRVPAVVVTTAPTELLQTDGPPQYSPIDRTQLLYVTNTPNRLFLDLRTQQHYVLLAGRWYRTSSLGQASWEYVSGTKLPADFAMIPDNHPTQAVRESVAGTPQAQEAAIANSVPQVATVKRTSARLEITYDGPPQFSPIEGTSLEYAVNAPVPVIRVDWKSFYALDNGVWFYSDAADGPWTTATAVPPVIYSIPHSSPLHYVTYVRVYDSTAETVSVGYTPGYVGSYVTSETTVVYGTGWYYRPWVGSVWYATPVTWGFGFSVWNTWWHPWPRWHPRYVAFRPAPCFHPWWGPWRSRVVVRPAVVVVGGVRPIVAPLAGGAVPRGGVAINAREANVTNIYRRWGPRVAEARGPRPVITNQSLAPAVAATPRSRPVPTPTISNDNPDWRVLRQRDGQWQRFMGNGRWERVPAPSNNALGAPQSPVRDSAALARPAPTPGAAVVAPQPASPATINTPIARPAPMLGAPSDPSTPATARLPEPSGVRGSDSASPPRMPAGRIGFPAQRPIVPPVTGNGVGAVPQAVPRGPEVATPPQSPGPARRSAERVPVPTSQPVVPGRAPLERRSWVPRQEPAQRLSAPEPVVSGRSGAHPDPRRDGSNWDRRRQPNQDANSHR